MYREQKQDRVKLNSSRILWAMRGTTCVHSSSAPRTVAHTHLHQASRKLQDVARQARRPLQFLRVLRVPNQPPLRSRYRVSLCLSFGAEELRDIRWFAYVRGHGAREDVRGAPDEGLGWEEDVVVPEAEVVL